MALMPCIKAPPPPDIVLDKSDAVDADDEDAADNFDKAKLDIDAGDCELVDSEDASSVESADETMRTEEVSPIEAISA